MNRSSQALPLPGRRALLAATGALAGLAFWPAWAAPGADTRLLVLLLRGGMDGLHVLVPQADPAHARLRAALVPRALHPLDGLFALHGALDFGHALYGRGQLLPVVAVAPPYRQRSHFEAQDCLENGSATPGGASSGWLNRCAAALGGGEALALATVMPLILRGPGPAATWSPPLPSEVDPVLLQRLQPLYAADARLAPAFARALETQNAAAVTGAVGRLDQRMAAAAQFMAQAGGPRLAFVEDSGWDSHSNELALLARKLAELDQGLRAFVEHGAPIWDKTVVAVVSEFGRTAAANGTGGTDHGTGGLALLAGGALRGGRIAGDWPGLAPADLNDGRDLRATTDLRALFKGLLATHLRLPEAALAQVFPDSAGLRPMDGLVRG